MVSENRVFYIGFRMSLSSGRFSIDEVFCSQEFMKKWDFFTNMRFICQTYG